MMIFEILAAVYAAAVLWFVALFFVGGGFGVLYAGAKDLRVPRPLLVVMCVVSFLYFITLHLARLIVTWLRVQYVVWRFRRAMRRLFPGKGVIIEGIDKVPSVYAKMPPEETHGE